MGHSIREVGDLRHAGLNGLKWPVLDGEDEKGRWRCGREIKQHPRTGSGFLSQLNCSHGIAPWESLSRNARTWDSGLPGLHASSESLPEPEYFIYSISYYFSRSVINYNEPSILPFSLFFSLSIYIFSLLLSSFRIIIEWEINVTYFLKCINAFASNIHNRAFTEFSRNKK